MNKASNKTNESFLMAPLFPSSAVLAEGTNSPSHSSLDMPPSRGKMVIHLLFLLYESDGINSSSCRPARGRSKRSATRIRIRLSKRHVPESIATKSSQDRALRRILENTVAPRRRDSQAAVSLDWLVVATSGVCVNISGSYLYS